MFNFSLCSAGCFSSQPTVFFSHNKSALATSQPTSNNFLSQQTSTSLQQQPAEQSLCHKPLLLFFVRGKRIFFLKRKFHLCLVYITNNNGHVWFPVLECTRKLWPLIIVLNKVSLQNQLQNPALGTLKNLMRPLTAWLEDSYCSITFIANHRLITVIRFITKNYTHP